jgi:hypothetical protein
MLKKAKAEEKGDSGQIALQRMAKKKRKALAYLQDHWTRRCLL